MEDELRALLRRKAERLPPLQGVPPRMLLRARRGVALASAITGVVVAAAGVGTFAGLMAITGLGRVTPSRPAGTPRIAATIHLSTHPTSITTTTGSVWVRNGDGGSLLRIDPQKNQQVGPPVLCSMGALLADTGALWAVGDNSNLCLPGGVRKALTLFRMDPATGQVVGEIPVQSDMRLFDVRIAAGEGALWVANWSEPGTGDSSRALHGVLSRVDPELGRVTGRLALGKWAGGLAAGGGAVWVANTPDRAPGTLLRIDPTSMRVVARLKVGEDPGDVAFGYGSIWVANSADRTVMRIDPATNRVAAIIPVPGGAGALAIGESRVWTILSGNVSWLDPATNVVSAPPLKIGTGGGIAAGEGAVWVTSVNDQTVTRIELAPPSTPR
jgi:DNA-binding beta-propeller fold protein YncE